MVSLRPFHWTDAYAMGTPQEGQRGDDEALMRASVRQMAMQGPAWTVEAPDGRVVAMAGLCIQWPGYARAWAFVLDHSTQIERMEAARLALRMIGAADALGLRRVDATVREDFGQAQTFIARLGFKREAVMRGFGPDGADHGLWAKVAA